MWNYRELKVWKRTIDFSKIIYDVVKNFPHEEKFELGSQLRRAIVSVSSNIAEGAGRRTSKDFCNFLYMACGSVKEIESELFVAEKLGYLDKSKLNQLLLELDEIGKMISGLIKNIDDKNIR